MTISIVIMSPVSKLYWADTFYGNLKETQEWVLFLNTHKKHVSVTINSIVGTFVGVTSSPEASLASTCCQFATIEALFEIVRFYFCSQLTASLKVASWPNLYRFDLSHCASKFLSLKYHTPNTNFLYVKVLKNLDNFRDINIHNTCGTVEIVAHPPTVALIIETYDLHSVSLSNYILISLRLGVLMGMILNMAYWGPEIQAVVRQGLV